ncbi:MAG TPA: NAD(P)/FAD-dependent oxidoreductase [Verrucomicrobiota bacterium]|nr:NAD(P)/FAD-dependent oxidoreductase [Verrucomicrobiota bacterium]
MGSYEYDVAVVGGGSAGFAAARVLAAGGARLAVIDGSSELGGLCILRGCMPTKALLHAAELRQSIRYAASWGIAASDVKLDLARLFARKDELIAAFASDRRQQLESGNWDLIRAQARFTDPHTIEFSTGGGITAAQVVIATGSEIAVPPIPGLAETGYLWSDTALRLTQLPESLIVLGGGSVGLEFAQFFARLGARVTVVQRSAHVLSQADVDVARELEAALRSEGIEIFTETQILGCALEANQKSVRIQYQGQERNITADEIFLALGRQPFLAGLNLAAAGVAQNAGGLIQANARQQTSAPHIYAAGDCCGPYEIVHLAIQQGEVAARNILGQAAAMDDRLLLSVVFTDPAVATVGLTEITAKQAGTAFVRASYPFNDHGKSMILGAQNGFVKILAAPGTGEILGAACVGPQAGELIHELMVALAQRMSVAALAALPHYHPTLAEIWTYPAEELVAVSKVETPVVRMTSDKMTGSICTDALAPQSPLISEGQR